MRRLLRSYAVLSSATFLLWLPIPVASLFSPPDPESTLGIVLGMSLLFVPLLCWAALGMVTALLLKRRPVDEDLRAQIRLASFLFGPFGLVWSVWRLTEPR